MSFTKIMIHAVWRTKNNYPYLKEPIKSEIIGHIKEYTFVKGLRIDTINGHKDHLHCLYELPADITLVKSMMYLKGESSNWTNKQKYFRQKFGWADKYYAVSVGPTDCDRVRKYIENQERHHKEYTWNEQVDQFLKWYRIDLRGYIS